MISCEVKSIENKIFYEIRKIELKYLDKCLLIDHYYYKEWQDKSCPTESQSIIELIDLISKSFESHNLSSPVLVHCRYSKTNPISKFKKSRDLILLNLF